MISRPQGGHAGSAPSTLSMPKSTPATPAPCSSQGLEQQKVVPPSPKSHFYIFTPFPPHPRSERRERTKNNKWVDLRISEGVLWFKCPKKYLLQGMMHTGTPNELILVKLPLPKQAPIPTLPSNSRSKISQDHTKIKHILGVKPPIYTPLL